MDKIIKTPRVFISYSWSTEEKFDKVLLLATRLRHDGVDVVLDRWNLNHGQDKYAFMETMVKDNTIDRVLIMSDSIYAKKANAREGGAGTESQIICDELYNNVDSRKFIPILLERDDNRKECLPIYLRSRIYIDFSYDSKFEESYDELLRDLYDRPSLKIPPIGQPPAYLFEENTDTTETSILESQSLYKISTNPKKSNEILKEFISAFEKELYDYYPKYVEGKDNMSECVFQSIIAYLPLRNKFIKVFDNVLTEGIELDIDIIIRFFENQPKFYYPKHKKSWSFYEYDGFRYISRELFLYVIAILIRHERYKNIADLLYSKYNMYDKYGEYNNPCDFNVFNFDFDSIHYYYNNLKGNKYKSCMANIMIENIHNSVEQQYLVEADVLCGYVAQIRGLNWIPWLDIYKEEKKIEIVNRLYSCRYFEKVKCLFDVDNKSELITIVKRLKEESQENRRTYNGWFIPFLCDDINIDTICTSR